MGNKAQNKMSLVEVSSNEADKKNAGISRVQSASEGRVQATHPEYERYLELHQQFDGAGKKKLVRKCKSQLTPRPRTIWGT